MLLWNGPYISHASSTIEQELHYSTTSCTRTVIRRQVMKPSSLEVAELTEYVLMSLEYLDLVCLRKREGADA